MTKLVLSFLAAATIALPALAEPAAQPVRFTRDGVTFVATTTTDAAGDTVIVGYEEATKRPFALRLSHGRVTGQYAGQSVSYAAPDAGAATVTTIAASR